jgi:hypothetical protein
MSVYLLRACVRACAPSRYYLYVCVSIACVRACVRACFSKFFFSLFTFFVFFGISRFFKRGLKFPERGSFLSWANRNNRIATPFASSLYAYELIYGKPLSFATFALSFDRPLFPREKKRARLVQFGARNLIRVRLRIRSLDILFLLRRTGVTLGLG